MGDPHKPWRHTHLHAHTNTHTHTLYLQGSKHHHFLLCALNFLQQDGPLGLFVELVHSDGVILWGDWTQVLTGIQTNSEETQTLKLSETHRNITTVCKSVNPTMGKLKIIKSKRQNWRYGLFIAIFLFFPL